MRDELANAEKEDLCVDGVIGSCASSGPLLAAPG